MTTVRQAQLWQLVQQQSELSLLYEIQLILLPGLVEVKEKQYYGKTSFVTVLKTITFENIPVQVYLRKVFIFNNFLETSVFKQQCSLLCQVLKSDSLNYKTAD